MRKTALALALLLGSVASAFADDSAGVTGRWKTVDDRTHQVESIVRIWVEDGKLYGAIEHQFGRPEGMICDRCSGSLKNQRMKGLVLFSGLVWDGRVWDHGEVMDPRDGKVYSCKMELDGDGTLKVRGYLGVPAFGRTQRWVRAD